MQPRGQRTGKKEKGLKKSGKFEPVSSQVNQITAFIDGSNVYGSGISEARALRLGRRGRMRVTQYGGEELLPLAPDECANHNRRQYCFAAGNAAVEGQAKTQAVTLWLIELQG